MKIVIFDDDKDDRIKLKQYIKYWMQENNHPDTIILEYQTVRELLFSLPDLLHADVFFLDIMTPEGIDSGYRVAEEIRRNNIRSAIIFTTNSIEYLEDAYELSAYRYLIKPLKKDKICSALDRLVTSHLTGKSSSIFHGSDGEFIIDNDRIEYIEAFTVRHAASIQLVDGTCLPIKLSSSFSSLSSDVLSRDFVQCHRGYIINLGYIKGYNNISVTMSAPGKESVIPIGKQYRDLFISRLLAYYKGVDQ